MVSKCWFTNLFVSRTAGEFSSIRDFRPCVAANLQSLVYIMTREEHKSIIALLERTIQGAQTQVDIEADVIIRAFLVRNPDAAYRLTMLALALSEGPSPEQPDAVPRRKSWLATLLTRRARLTAAPVSAILP